MTLRIATRSSAQARTQAQAVADALVARGDADCYVRLSPSAGYRECIWDHAAGALIAGESGAVVTDAAGRALDFSCSRRFRDSSGIVCATPRLHASLVDLLAGAGPAE